MAKSHSIPGVEPCIYLRLRIWFIRDDECIYIPPVSFPILLSSCILFSIHGIDILLRLTFLSKIKVPPPTFALLLPLLLFSPAPVSKSSYFHYFVEIFSLAFQILT